MWFMVHGSQAKPTYSAVFRSVFKKASGGQKIHKNIVIDK